MRHALIVLNIILAVLLAIGAVNLFRNGGAGGKTVYTVKKVTRSEMPKSTVRKTAVREKLPPEEMQKVTLENNIFDSSRCPAAVSGNLRTTMVLVGTFTAGEISGAIVLQKSTSRNSNFMMGPPPMPGGGGRRMGFMQNNGNSRNGNRSGNRTGNRGGFGGGMMPPMPGGMPPFRMNQNENGQNSNTAVRLKQYVKVGETLENGYRLVSVSRTGAVFERSGEKLELEIQDASKNAPKTAAKTNTNARQNMVNQIIQGFQNMQRQQGFQNMQMMRMMQQNTNRQQPGGGSRSGGRRR